jgi:hypothetical protein
MAVSWGIAIAGLLAFEGSLMVEAAHVSNLAAGLKAYWLLPILVVPALAGFLIWRVSLIRSRPARSMRLRYGGLLGMALGFGSFSTSGPALWQLVGGIISIGSVVILATWFDRREKRLPANE